MAALTGTARAPQRQRRDTGQDLTEHCSGRRANDVAKLKPALDIFYALLLLQSLFSAYYLTIYGEEDNMPRRTNKYSGLARGRLGGCPAAGT
jgi:hypothetical protein